MISRTVHTCRSFYLLVTTLKNNCYVVLSVICGAFIHVNILHDCPIFKIFMEVL